MSEFGTIGSIGSQCHKVDPKKDLDNAGGMVMASLPQHNSLYTDNNVTLTEKQRTGSIFC